MPAIGRTTLVKSNVVTSLPSLPIPMYYGSVAMSLSFEGFPSGSLEYNGVAESDLAALEKAYKVSNAVNIYGIAMRVASYGYQREGYVVRDRIKFSVYKVSVSLESKYEQKADTEVKLSPIADSSGKVSISAIAGRAGVPYSGRTFNIQLPDSSDKDYAISLKSAVEAHARILGCYVSYDNGIELKPLLAGASWNFPADQVITDGQNTLQLEPAYNNTELTGGFTSVLANDTDTPESIQFTYADPNVQAIIEEDEYPEDPPKGSTVLRTLDSCFDGSGPKKVRKITTQMYDNPESEETWIYGFVYTAADMFVVGKDFFTDKVKQLWKPIEYQKTQYIYKSLPPVTLNVRAYDPDNPSVEYPVVIHPDYEQFATASLFGGSVTFSSTVSYLTEVVSRGWKLVRFERENSDSPATLDPEDPFYEACQFFKIPIESKTAYKLLSSRLQYGDDIGAPFSVEWIKYDELDPRIKQKINNQRHITKSGLVAVLTPDINYAEPLLVEVESSATSSFAYMAHPENEPDVMKSPLVTGEETYNHVKRTITSTNRYREKSTEFSAQDPGFSVSSEQIKFKEVLGRPPEASYRMAKSEQKPTKKAKTNNQESIQPRYFITSDKSSNVAPGGSVGYPTATTIDEAVTGALTELKITESSGSQESKTISWFYPQIRGGDRVTTGMDRFAGLGTWIVKGASWTLEYGGNVNRYSKRPLVTCDGCQLTLGRISNRSVTYTVRQDGLPSEGSQEPGEGQIKVDATGSFYTLGDVIPNIPNRRRF